MTVRSIPVGLNLKTTNNLPPSMLTLNGLLAPVARAETPMTEIWQATTKTDGSIILDHGLFVLMVSTFEVMLSDCLRYFLTHKPEKLEFKDETLDAKEILAYTLPHDLLLSRVERKVRGIGYKSLREVIRRVTRDLGINSPGFPPHVEDAIDGGVARSEAWCQECRVGGVARSEV